MNRKTIVHPSVIRIIHAVLVDHGFPRRELLEHTSVVAARALETIEGGRAPQRLREWQNLAAATAAAYAVEAGGTPPAGPARDPGICDDPDEQAPWLRRDPRDPNRTRFQIAVMNDLFDHGEMPDMAREILARIADGVKVDDIAEELTLPVDDVRRRLRRIRALFFMRLAFVETLAAQLQVDVVAGDQVEELLAWLR
ncbi:MAG TPA: hypothetical protein VGL81_22510 [Polyangiaceae bacterium]|jgi:hypothetical protein